MMDAAFTTPNKRSSSSCSSKSSSSSSSSIQLHDDEDMVVTSGPASGSTGPKPQQGTQLDMQQGHDQEQQTQMTQAKKQQTQTQTQTPGTLRFFVAGSMIPQRSKTGDGEDAFFISSEGLAMGVSDGVGGWADVGVDSGQYSRELMEHAEWYADKHGDHEHNPRDILTHAYDQSKSVGTATACILTLDDAVLRAANLGDSGFVLFRPTPNGMVVVVQSEGMQHYWNCPRQLGTNSLDKPTDAEEYEVPVQEGDIVVVGTDGLFDNMSEDEIVEALNMLDCEFTISEEDLCKVTEHLATVAFHISRERRRKTPFARSAKRHGVDYQGGKEDDITVLFAIISRDDDDDDEDDDDSSEGAFADDITVAESPNADFFLPPSAFGMTREDDAHTNNSKKQEKAPSLSPQPASAASMMEL